MSQFGLGTGSLICALALFAQLNQSSCFWFADSSLFRPNEDQVAPILPATPPTATVQSITLQAPRGADNQRQQAGQDGQTNKKQEECQCSPEWVQNYTNWAVSRWLNSAQTGSHHQLRSLAAMSNSTGAQTHIVGRSNQSIVGRSYWPSDITSNNSPFNLTTTKPVTSSSSSKASGASNGWPRPTSARHSRHGQQQQQQSIKLVPGERGPQGPKGDTGARGERGEPGKSGLIVVKDQLELFEKVHLLDSTSQGVTAGSQQMAPDFKEMMLVFVEAEQMLVVRTSSGWRPIQLQRPLKDLTKVDPVKSRAGSASETANVGHNWQDNGLAIRDREKGSHYNNNDEVDDEDDDEEEDDEDLDDDDADLDDWDDSVELDDEDDDDDDDDVDDDKNVIGDESKAVRQRKSHHSKGELTVMPFLFQRRQPKPTSTHLKVAGRSALASLPAPSPLEMGPAESSINRQHEMMPSESESASASSQNKHQELKLRLAALNEPFSGNIHGLRGADFECKRHAAKARLKGSFRALLATGFQNLNELVRLNTHKYPIVNLRGETLARSWNDLFKQQQQHQANPLSRIYSFDGRHVATDSNWPNKLVWHGAANRAGYRDLANNCDGWHSDSLNKFGSATALHNPRNQLTQQQQQQLQKRRHKKRSLDRRNSTVGLGSFFEPIEKYPCRMPLVVLCIETIGQPLVVSGPKLRGQQLENGWDSEISNSL